MQGKASIKQVDVLSKTRYELKNITFEIINKKGKPVEETREVYDRGDAATILLYNKEKQVVLLTRQFRLPSFINGNESGMLLETCAGLLEGDDPETCIRRESEEETGYRLREVQKVFQAYTSAGGLTEIIHYFVAVYRDEDKIAEGGGLEEEQEEIHLVELPYQKALQMLEKGEIQDAKTIILLQYAQIHKLFES